MRKYFFTLTLVILLVNTADAFSHKDAIDDFAMYFSLSLRAKESCANVELDISGIEKSMKILGIIPEDMPAVVERFSIEKPRAKAEVLNRGAEDFCKITLNTLGPNSTGPLHFIKFKN
jgi:hypothetical protein